MALSNASGDARYYTDTAQHNLKHNEYGSSLLRWAANMDEQHAATVPLVALDCLLRTVLLPVRGPRPHVGMKLDCEGCEYDALPPAADLLCETVDRIWLERHDRFFSERWRGHKKGFASEGRVEALDAALASMRQRTGGGAAAPCRTEVHRLSTAEHRRQR